MLFTESWPTRLGNRKCLQESWSWVLLHIYLCWSRSLSIGRCFMLEDFSLSKEGPHVGWCGDVCKHLILEDFSRPRVGRGVCWFGDVCKHLMLEAFRPSKVGCFGERSLVGLTTLFSRYPQALTRVKSSVSASHLGIEKRHGSSRTKILGFPRTRCHECGNRVHSTSICLRVSCRTRLTACPIRRKFIRCRKFCWQWWQFHSSIINDDRNTRFDRVDGGSVNQNYLLNPETYIKDYRRYAMV